MTRAAMYVRTYKDDFKQKAQLSLERADRARVSEGQQMTFMSSERQCATSY